jgi:hypothetical protein
MRDAIGRDLAEFRDLEVMHPNRLGLALGTQLLAGVLEVADQLFLLGVDGDGRRSRRDGGLYRRIDVLELRVAIGMAGALAGLPVGLAAVFQLAQQHAHQLLARREALLAQRLGNVALAAADPAQRRFRIAADRMLDQRFERRQQAGLSLDRTFAPPAGTPHPAADLVATRLQLGNAAIDRAPRNAGRSRNRCHTAHTNGHRLRRGKQPPAPLVEERHELLVPRSNAADIDHHHSIW